nr:MAG TPA: hypothetical protein [Caudoviricetes sp.]
MYHSFQIFILFDSFRQLFHFCIVIITLSLNTTERW